MILATGYIQRNPHLSMALTIASMGTWTEGTNKIVIHIKKIEFGS